MLYFFRIFSYFNLIVAYLVLFNLKKFYYYIFEGIDIEHDKIITIFFSNKPFIIILIYLAGIEFIKSKERKILNFILASFLILYFLIFGVTRYCLIYPPGCLGV